MKATAALRTLDEITASQWGLVTTAQASGRNVTRIQLARLASDGHFLRLSHGVYRSAGSPPSRYESVQAAWLSTEPSQMAESRLRASRSSIVVGGATASYLHEIGDLQPEPFVFVSRSRRQSKRAEMRFRMRELSPQDTTLVAGLPVSSVEETLAELVRMHEDRSLVVDTLSDAVRGGQVDLPHLTDLLSPLAAANGHRSGDGASFLASLLEETSYSIR